MTNKQAAGVKGLLDTIRSGAGNLSLKIRGGIGGANKPPQPKVTYYDPKGNEIQPAGTATVLKNKALNAYDRASYSIPNFAQKHKNALIGAGVTTGLAGTGLGAAYAFGGKKAPPAAAAGAPGAPGAGSLQLTPGSLGAGVADMLPLEARTYLQNTLGPDGYVRALRGLGGAGIGAGIGLGAGAIGNLMSPRKKRKSLFEDAITSALIGGGLGGAAGAIDPIYNAVSGAMGAS
jgi:hypothetical protein